MTKSPILLEPSSKMLRITTSKKRKRVVSELVETDLKLPLKENTETKSTRSLDSSTLKNVYDTHSILSRKIISPNTSNQVKKKRKRKKKVTNNLSLLQHIKRLEILQQKAKTKINNQREQLRQKEVNLTRKNNIYSNLEDKYNDLKKLSYQKEQCFSSIQTFYTDQIQNFKNELKFVKESMMKIIQKGDSVEKVNDIKQLLAQLSKHEFDRAPSRFVKDTPLNELSFPKILEYTALEKVEHHDFLQNNPDSQTSKSIDFKNSKKRVQYDPRKEEPPINRKRKFSKLSSKGSWRKKVKNIIFNP